MRRIHLNPILSDIRSGIGDDQLMKNYQLRPEPFGRLLLTLVEQEFIEHEGLYGKSPTYRHMFDISDSRDSLRVKIPDAIRIYNCKTSERGFIRDISERGVRVAGLKVQVGESMPLFVPLKEMMSRKSLKFNAVCRWAKTKGRSKKFTVAGFQITDIPAVAKRQWFSLIHLFKPQGSLDTQIAHDPLNVPETLQSAPEMRSQTSTHDFSGTINEVDILDFVQFILLSGKRLVLRVSGPDGTKCTLYFDNGKLVHAVQGHLQGKEAFYECMNLPRGKFVTQSWFEPAVRSIDLPGEFLLMEAARRRDESSPRTGLDGNGDDEEDHTGIQSSTIFRSGCNTSEQW